MLAHPGEGVQLGQVVVQVEDTDQVGDGDEELPIQPADDVLVLIPDPKGVPGVSTGARNDGIAVGVAVPGLVAAFGDGALEHHLTLAGFGDGLYIVAASRQGLPVGLADGLGIGNGAPDNGIFQDGGGIHMIHDGDGVLADHCQSPNQILAPLVVKDVGEHGTLAELVHHAHGAHGNALEEVGGVLEGRHAPACRVAVHNGSAGHGTDVEGGGGVAAAQLRGDHRADLTTQEPLQLLHAQNVEAFVGFFQTGVFFDFLLGQRADGSAGIGGADHILRGHFLEGGELEFLPGSQSLIDHLDALVQASAAAGAQDGAAVENIQQIFMI